MGGIIQGFLGGVGQGMAQAGQMFLADKLAGERDEADFLRRSELRKSENLVDREFRSGENKLSREATASEGKLGRESAERIADKKAKAILAKGGTDTTNVRDAKALMAQGYPKDVANAVAHGALKQIKDEDTGDMVLVNALNNTPVGRLTTIGGKKQWLPEGELPENADVTAKHRKAAKSMASDKAGVFSLDSTDFPSTKGDRKQWIRDESQRIANEERSGKQTVKKPTVDKPGIVSSQAGGDTKMVGQKEMTKAEFVEAMSKKYPGEVAKIEETWNSIP